MNVLAAGHGWRLVAWLLSPLDFPTPQPQSHRPHFDASAGVLLYEIVTGEVPLRGRLAVPRAPEQCPQVRALGDGQLRTHVYSICFLSNRLSLPAQQRPKAMQTRGGCEPTHAAQAVVDLMLRCMSEDAAQRPTANQLVRQSAWLQPCA